MIPFDITDNAAVALLGVFALLIVASVSSPNAMAAFSATEFIANLSKAGSRTSAA